MLESLKWFFRMTICACPVGVSSRSPQSSSVCLLSSTTFWIACFVYVQLFMQPFINTLNKYKLHIMEGTVCQGVFSEENASVPVCKPAHCILLQWVTHSLGSHFFPLPISLFVFRILCKWPECICSIPVGPWVKTTSPQNSSFSLRNFLRCRLLPSNSQIRLPPLPPTQSSSEPNTVAVSGRLGDAHLQSSASLLNLF